MVKIEHVGIWQGSILGERIGGILLEFSDKTSVDHTLENRNRGWQEVALPTRPKTNFVKITIKSVYGNDKDFNYGFSEIEVYGCLIE